ncbi:hypothetical protein [Bradyrhizobium canariense]|uniref:hypothetical protein n=1 Tax=Bradyrhizobium canariense TaxID=255045 RepID=UPI0018EA09D3|nr:hypothetical protein [Bradyrhizobium canariense]
MCAHDARVAGALSAQEQDTLRALLGKLAPPQAIGADRPHHSADPADTAND